MREIMIHFSREIARSARNNMYQFLSNLEPNLTEIQAKFIFFQKESDVPIYMLQLFVLLLLFDNLLIISPKNIFQSSMMNDIESSKTISVNGFVLFD